MEKHDTSCLCKVAVLSKPVLEFFGVNINLKKPSRQIELHWNPTLGSVVRPVYAQGLMVEDGALQITVWTLNPCWCSTILLARGVTAWYAGRSPKDGKVLQS